jgi:C4-dicarboxylate-specific signal transduction histidine kinase
LGSILRLQRMPQKDGEFVVALERITEEANRAAEIIRRVKTFVQKREPRFTVVFVNSLVKEAVLFTRMELERSHTRIVLELAEDLPAVVGDPIQIEQVIMNLVRNGLEAMDQTPDDSRLLCIRTLRHGESTVQVDVCDGGKGISETDLEKVLEPFYTTKPEGMGMGLAISRSILQTHGGRLWATANQEGGCTFHFTLPIGKKD